MVLGFDVGGQDELVGFTPAQRSYDVVTTGDTVSLRTQSRDAGAMVTYAWLVDDVSIDSGAIGLGGGEVTLSAPDLIVDNGTISQNSAANAGGAIYAPEGVLFLSHSTVSQNDTPSNVGFADIHVAPFPGLMVASTVIDGDCRSQNVTSGGYNLESPGDTCKLSAATDQSMVTPAQLSLGPLADNGGPTETHALLAGSVAIDLIPGAQCVDDQGAPLTQDQRGAARPQGSACDVGAFEFDE